MIRQMETRLEKEKWFNLRKKEHENAKKSMF